MTPKQEAAMRQALEALEAAWLDASMGKGDVARHTKAITALREALAEPQAAEPVAWMVMNGVCDYQLFWSKNQAEALADEMQKRHDLSGSLAAFHVQPLYTHPAPTHQPLTDEQKAVLRECRNQAMKWTGQAGIPECGAFGGMAQDLDWLCGQLGIAENEKGGAA